VTAKPKKIAMVFTHGMGEQIPMETLIGFVEAAWVANTDAHWAAPPDENPRDTWFTPDPVTGSLELRRITTRWTARNGGFAWSFDQFARTQNSGAPAGSNVAAGPRREFHPLEAPGFS
jgi:hypothetical protein